MRSFQDRNGYTFPVLAELLLKWPLIRQLKTGADGTGVESMSDATHALRPKNENAEVARSICPYCGVGCGQLVYHRDGKVVSIEGDPESPISRGHLCPKGSASYQLVTHEGRATKVKYRAARSKKWQVERTCLSDFRSRRPLQMLDYVGRKRPGLDFLV